jgi:hypothetical protein
MVDSCRYLGTPDSSSTTVKGDKNVSINYPAEIGRIIALFQEMNSRHLGTRSLETFMAAYSTKLLEEAIKDPTLQELYTNEMYSLFKEAAGYYKSTPPRLIRLAVSLLGEAWKKKRSDDTPVFDLLFEIADECKLPPGQFPKMLRYLLLFLENDAAVREKFLDFIKEKVL